MQHKGYITYKTEIYANKGYITGLLLITQFDLNWDLNICNTSILFCKFAQYISS